MRYASINIFGVYVAPFAPMMLAAWLMTFCLRVLADRFNLLRVVWHPALFTLAVYVMILAVIVLGVGRLGWA